jgi:hypothetical protein
MAPVAVGKKLSKIAAPCTPLSGVEMFRFEIHPAVGAGNIFV